MNALHEQGKEEEYFDANRREQLVLSALLHDLGRYRQYEEAIPHALASSELAEQILPAAGYTNQETTWIVNAIREHGVEPQEQGQLARILYDADKLSRNCFDCAAQAECKWPKSKRNRTIVY
jgi:HD superfamily phosphodiesterase